MWRDARWCRQSGALPREIVVVEDDSAVVLSEHRSTEARGVRIDRKRAKVFDDHEVGIRGAAVGRLDGEERHTRVVGSQDVVELAGDAPDVETEFAERPLPFPCLD